MDLFSDLDQPAPATDLFSDLDAPPAKPPGDLFSDLDAPPQDLFSDLDPKPEDNPPGTVLSRTVSGIPAAFGRGVVGLNQFAAGALKAADPFGGIFPDSSFQQAMGGAIAQGETTKQAIPPNPNRNIVGEVLDTVAESLPQALPAMGGAAAGTTLALKALNVGVGSGAVEYFNAKRDFFARAGIDLANPQAVAAAEANPQLNAAAEDFATRRAAVVGALDTATLGASSRIGGTAPVRAAARVATEAAGGAAGEAGAQVSTEGKVTDWKNVAMEAAGEVIPGAVEVAAARGPRGTIPATPTATPPPPTNWMTRQPPAPGAPGTSQAPPAPPTTPAQPPEPTAPVSNDTPSTGPIPPSIPPVSPANPEAPTASQLSPVEHPVQELPVATLRLSKDVPNFKEDARDDTGEVRGQELKGRYIRLGTAPVVVWERLNGDREIITGRHRFALARRSGERTIPAQVVREADGFTRAQALVFDAEANIRDNQGTTRDYAHFFRNSGLTRAEADSRGLVSRSKGQQGASLGYDASDDLYSLYRAKKLAEPKAVAIARAAPGRADLQRVGVAAAIEDPSMSAEDLENYVSYLAANAPAPAPGMAQTDLFGADETFLKEAIRTAKAVSQIRDGIQQRLAVLKTGQRLTSGQRKQIAQDVGIQIKTPADIDAARTTLEAEADAWTRWKTDPAKIAAARTRAGLPPTGTAAFQAAPPPAAPIPGAPGTSPATVVKDSLTTPPAVEAAAAPSVPTTGTPPNTAVPVTGTSPQVSNDTGITPRTEASYRAEREAYGKPKALTITNPIRSPISPVAIRFVPVRSKKMLAPHVKAIAVRLNGKEEPATSQEISEVAGHLFFQNETAAISWPRLRLWLDRKITDDQAANGVDFVPDLAPQPPVVKAAAQPPNNKAAPISGDGVESSTKPESAAAPTRTEDNRIAVRATGATSDSDVEMPQSPDIVNTELSTPPPERDPAKSAKAKILAAPAKYLPDMTPQAVLDEIKKWQVVSKSPFSASLYDITNKSFGPDPEGHLRLADHWNYTIGGEEVHGKTDRKVPEHSWALARKEGGIYRVLKVWKSLNEDLRIKFKAERAAKSKLTEPQREILLALEKGPVHLTPKQARTMKAWWSKGGWYFTEAMEGDTASLNAVGRAVVKNGKINLAAASKLANSFKMFPQTEEIPVETLPLLIPAPRSPLPADLTLQSPTTAELDAEAAQRTARDTKRSQADQMAARAAAPLQGDSSGVGQGTLFAQDADLFSGPAAQDQAAAATDQAEPILTVQDKAKRKLLQVHLHTLPDGRFSAQYDITTNTAGVMSTGGPKSYVTRQEAITAAADNIIQWVTRTRDTQGSGRTAAQDAQLNQIHTAAEELKATAQSSPLPAPRSQPPTNKHRPSRGTAAMADPFGPESAQPGLPPISEPPGPAGDTPAASPAAAPLPGYVENEAGPLPKPTDPDDPRFSVVDMDMPELVALMEDLAGGRHVKVREKMRRMGVLGTFRSFDGFADSGQVTIRADQFRVVPRAVREQIATKARDFAQAQLDAGTILEDQRAQVEAEHRAFLMDAARADYVQRNQADAMMVLRHELGHHVDFLEAGTLKRGNILGHVAALKKYMRSVLPLDPNSNEDITPKDRARFRREAERLAGTRPAKTDTGAMQTWSARVAELYSTKVDEAMETRGLVSRRQIMEELVPLFQWYNGQQDVSYFTTPEEAYAEAFSILLNNPVALGRRAPLTYGLLTNYMNERPNVRAEFDLWNQKIQAGTSKMDAAERLRDNTRKANEIADEERLRRDLVMPGTVADNILFHIDRVFGPVYRRLNKIAKRDPGTAQATRATIGDYRYRGASLEAFALDTQASVVKRLLDAGIHWETFSEYLFHNRVAFEPQSQEVANPGGWNAPTSKARLDEMKAEQGPAKAAILEESRQQFRRAYEHHVLSKLEGVLSEAQVAELLDREYYATFAAVRSGKAVEVGQGIEAYLTGRFGSGVTAKIYKRVGNLGKIRDPAAATFAKGSSLISFAAREKAKAAVVDMLQTHFRSEITPARREFTGPGRVRFVEEQNINVGTIYVMRNGDLEAFYVPRAIADAFQGAARIENNAMIGALATGMGVFKGTLTGANPTFWPVALTRDIFDFLRKMPGRPAMFFGNKALMRYLPKAMADAASLIHGNPTEAGMRALEMGVVVPLGTPQGEAITSEGNSLEREILKHTTSTAQYRRKMLEVESEIDGFWSGVSQFFRGALKIGTVFERSMKIAGMHYLEANFPDMSLDEKKHVIRTLSGSPDFLDKGASNLLLDVGVQLFYNPWKQGWRSELDSFQRGKADYLIQNVKYVGVPAMVILGLSQGWLADLLGGDDEDRDEIKRMMARISDYTKRNYLAIPLGWADDKQDKVVTLKLPMSDAQKVFYNVALKSMEGNPTEAASAGIDLVAGTMMGDTGTPWAKIVKAYYAHYVDGQNPIDNRLKRGILDPDVHAARHLTAANDIDMMKWAWNQSGVGTLFHRFRMSRDPGVATNETPTENLLSMPFVSAGLGRWLGVESRGITEQAARLVAPEEERRAFVRLQVDRFLAKESLTPDERTALQRDPYAAEYLRRRRSALNRRGPTTTTRAVNTAPAYARPRLREALQ